MPAAKLDPINLRILEELQANGRISNQELAERVALSPSACLVRVRRLEADGVIRRYLADLDLDRLDHVLEAFIQVTLGHHERSELDRFEAAMREHPQVLACHRVSGQFDALLQVAARDMPQLTGLADFLLSSGLGVSKIATIPVLERWKAFSGYPLRRVLHGIE
jgi:DNA-binding Lrp family transcriptional regulator